MFVNREQPSGRDWARESGGATDLRPYGPGQSSARRKRRPARFGRDTHTGGGSRESRLCAGWVPGTHPPTDGSVVSCRSGSTLTCVVSSDRFRPTVDPQIRLPIPMGSQTLEPADRRLDSAGPTILEQAGRHLLPTFTSSCEERVADSSPMEGMRMQTIPSLPICRHVSSDLPQKSLFSPFRTPWGRKTLVRPASGCENFGLAGSAAVFHEEWVDNETGALGRKSRRQTP